MGEPTVANGAVYGPVRIWLRAEGIAVAALGVLFYRNSGMHWWIFLALLLTPDLAMVFYLVNSKVGGACYNVVHSYFLPVSLAAIATGLGGAAMLPYLAIWIAHIGMDRFLGYGLKYPMAFGRTHLGDLTRIAQ